MTGLSWSSCWVYTVDCFLWLVFLKPSLSIACVDAFRCSASLPDHLTLSDIVIESTVAQMIEKQLLDLPGLPKNTNFIKKF